MNNLKGLKKYTGLIKNQCTPDEITEKTLIPKELGDMIEKEVVVFVKKGWSLDKAINLGTRKAVEKWRKENADKSRS